MANWDPKTVEEVVEEIDAETIVLPVIQRNLVWEEEKMELLFDSVLKGNSFGGIMAIEEFSRTKPLFAFRKFSRDGAIHDAYMPEKLDRITKLIIDGQQRLQAFYMGLLGSFNDKALHFNLYSKEDYDFDFSHPADLNTKVKEDGEERFWYPVKILYERLSEVRKHDEVSKEIIFNREIEDEESRDQIRKNVNRFWEAVFTDRAVGISKVYVDKTIQDIERRRMVELFRRLNDGGTRLSTLDLAASILKGFDERLEVFLRREVPEFKDMGIDQDEVIKLLFLLRGDSKKDLMDIVSEDADYVFINKERIIKTLNVLRQFLKDANLYEFFKDGSRSVIPLYFIAYHIFHKDTSTSDLGSLYINHDTNNADFINMKRWVFLSLLNGVFSRGKGWTPYKTGINKILGVMQNYKNCLFPAEELFKMYDGYGLKFSREITSSRMPYWDLSFLFYIMYDCSSKTGRDVDHVQPRSLLESRNVDPQKIHSPANFQLLDEERNRNEKRAKQFKDWISDWDASVRDNYLARHLIPKDPELWSLAKFDELLTARTDLILEKVQNIIPPQSIPSQAIGSGNGSHPSVQVVQQQSGPKAVDKNALKAALPKELQDHPILSDTTTWQAFFRAHFVPSWAGKYIKELHSHQIFTIADFALFVMSLGIQFSYKDKYGDFYVFKKPLPNGQRVNFASKLFGGWGWASALEQLEKRGLNWRDFIVK
jgi:uncharacterized protein with ParB-like and HNH nuclease domain